jgi:hypothetical protein
MTAPGEGTNVSAIMGKDREKVERDGKKGRENIPFTAAD